MTMKNAATLTPAMIETAKKTSKESVAHLRSMPDVFQTLAKRWLRYSADQVQNNIDAWAAMSACNDSDQFAAIGKRWAQSTFDRMTAETKEFQEEMLGLMPSDMVRGAEKLTRQVQDAAARAA